MKNSLPIVAIVGRSNVGKSSLFNAIIGRREAIVADEPGTTRDNVTAKTSWEGKDFWLVDTAGLKNPGDEFEMTIQQQIAEAAAEASAIIVVVETGIPPTPEDRQAATISLKSRKPVFLAVNKSDTGRRGDLSEWLKLGIKSPIAVSAIHKSGIDELLTAVIKELPKSTVQPDESVIKVGLLGRPNVGKSSLFNSLAGKQQAIVAARSGTTRDINRVRINYHSQTIEFADTAGIRRSGKIERGIEHFSVLRSLAVIEAADICLLLMDAGELNVQLDQKIAGMIKEAGKGLVLVVTKWDQANIEDKDKQQVADEVAENYAFAPWAPLVFTSAVTGENVTKLFELITAAYAARQEKFRTTELNRWLTQVTHRHPPAGLKGYTPKLNYMVQESEQPLPSFKLFGSRTKYLHWSYRRYLEHQFREQWPCAGTPIKFWFIDKHVQVE